MGKDHRKGKRLPTKSVVKRYRQVTSNGARILLHRERAEMALGYRLPIGAVVHHADGSKRDDAPLVICQDEGYHKFLHRRMRIKAAGGDPNTEKICARCRLVKPRTDFPMSRGQADGLHSYCRPCGSEYTRQLKVRSCA